MLISQKIIIGPFLCIYLVEIEIIDYGYFERVFERDARISNLIINSSIFFIRKINKIYKSANTTTPVDVGPISSPELKK